MFAFIIPHCPLSVKQKAKKLYQGSLAAPSGGGAPRSPRCPLWGKCRAAAKGVSLVILSCCHSSNNTPSVSLCSTAPPLGSQGPRCPLWGWCSAKPSLPPLGEVPRSGKGGAVGNFELLPFIEQHPLSLALLDSSPIGEPRASLPPLGVVRRTALAAPSGGSAAQRQRGCRW